MDRLGEIESFSRGEVIVATLGEVTVTDLGDNNSVSLSSSSFFTFGFDDFLFLCSQEKCLGACPVSRYSRAKTTPSSARNDSCFEYDTNGSVVGWKGRVSRPSTVELR